MAINVEYRDGLWLVSEGGVPVYSGAYRQVEDWLDLAENAGRLTPAPPPVAAVPPARGKGLPTPAQPRHTPAALAQR
jgi:hypothetical protein